MEFPQMVRVRQHFFGPTVRNIPQEVREQLKSVGFAQHIRPGMKIAITAGSRGIANIGLILRSVAREIRELGGTPMIVPAMGSHGGATAEGQVEVLAELGITESVCEAPIVSAMDVVEIGQTPEGIAVHMDKHAYEADGVVLIGRVKLHTDFKSPSGFESGLLKMAAIGLGKHKQALLLHRYGIHGIRDLMPSVAKVVLEKGKIVCGLAIVENALEQTAYLEAIKTADIVSREPKLLEQSARLMPKLPVDDVDILIVDYIGKNFSGTGMDTNIIGRIRILGVDEPARPRIKHLIACDLSAESHGNALGIGLADLTTKRLFQKIDMRVTNENVITSSFLLRAMIPIVLNTDYEAIGVALRATWGVDPTKARVIRIPNTLHLQEIEVSTALLPELSEIEGIEVLGEPRCMQFDTEDNLLRF